MTAEALTDSLLALPPMTQVVILLSLASWVGATVTMGNCEQAWFYQYQWAPADRADAYEVYEIWPGGVWTISTVVFTPAVFMKIKPPGRDGVKVRGILLADTPLFGPFSEASDPEPRIETE